MESTVQTIHHFQHVSCLPRFELNGSRRGGHQKGCRNSLASDISNHYLNCVVVDGYVVVVIATYTSRRLHHAGDFQSWDGGPMDGQKHPLNLCGQLNILQKLIALLAHCLIKLFSLFHVSLDDVNDKGE